MTVESKNKYNFVIDNELIICNIDYKMADSFQNNIIAFKIKQSNNCK